MPNLVYTIPAYTPFTKILSANANQDKTDVQNRLNWSGTPGDVTTGLDGTNIQGITATAEVKATLTTQGVTATALPGWAGNGNSINLAFTAGATAGSEVVTVTGTAISVQVATGVSTVTQVVAALTGSVLATRLASFSGSAVSTVATASALSLSGGVAGSGLSRTSKLTLDKANQIVVNDANGQLNTIDLVPLIQGGTNLRIIPGNQNAGDVLQIDPTKTTLILGAPSAIPASLRILTNFHYS